MESATTPPRTAHVVGGAAFDAKESPQLPGQTPVRSASPSGPVARIAAVERPTYLNPVARDSSVSDAPSGTAAGDGSTRGSVVMDELMRTASPLNRRVQSGVGSPGTPGGRSPAGVGSGGITPSKSTRSLLSARSTTAFMQARKRRKSLTYDDDGLPKAPAFAPPEHVPPSAMVNFFVNGTAMRLAPRSLYLFPEDSRVRRLFVFVAFHSWFEAFIISVIVFNSITLALADYSPEAVDPITLEPDPAKSWRNNIGAVASPVFSAVFFAEFVIKVVAMGFCLDRGSYLSDMWNWLDFMVVVTGAMEAIPGMPRVSMLRVFRVLRPLRTIRSLPGMRLLVVSLLNSIPQLANVMALLGFIFFVFGILGLQLWAGAFHARCRLTPYPVALDSSAAGVTNHFDMMKSAYSLHPSAEAAAYLDDVIGNRTAFPRCSDAEGVDIPLDEAAWNQQTSPWAAPRDCVWPIDRNDSLLCSAGGTGAHSCAVGLVCGANYDRFGNPRFSDDRVMRFELWSETLLWGFITFDNIGSSFLTIFQSITLEGWTDVMYMLGDSSSAPVAAFYFMLLVLIGSFFLLNLTLAVIWASLAALKEELAKALDDAEQEEAAAEGAEYLSPTGMSDADDADFSSDAGATRSLTDDGGDPSVGEMRGRVGSDPRISARQSVGAAADVDPTADAGGHAEAKPLHVAWASGTVRREVRVMELTHAGDDAEVAVPSQLGGDPVIGDKASASVAPEAIKPKAVLRVQTRGGDAPAAAGVAPGAGTPRGAAQPTGASSGAHAMLGATGRKSSSRRLIDREKRRKARAEAAEAKRRKLASKPPWERFKLVWRWRLYKLVNHKVFTGFVISLIVINTAVLALDQHPMDQGLANWLEVINVCLTLAFTVEMLLKLLALGWSAYNADRFNTFDMIIVVESLIELALSPPNMFNGQDAAIEGGGGISALRTFRLFRVFKLVKNWVSLRMLLSTIIVTVADVANFALLLILFMYIASLVGQQFFANTFHFDEDGEHIPFGSPDFGKSPDEVPRAHFDSFTWSFVTVFQLLTGEDWNKVMYDGWKANGVGFALYFVTSVALGNWVMINLFLAILLGNFEGLEDKTSAEQEEIKERLANQKSEHADAVLGSAKEFFASANTALDSPERGATHRSLFGSARPKSGILAFAHALGKHTSGRWQRARRVSRGPSIVDDGNIFFNKGANKSVAGAIAEDRAIDASGRTLSDDEDEAASGTDGTHVMIGRSLCCLGRTNKFRRFCYELSQHKQFDNAMLGLIFVSSVLLAIDDPLRDPAHWLNGITVPVGVVITCAFAMESLVKIIAFGFWLDEGAYLKSGWNVLDFSLVVISILDLFAGDKGALKSLRSLRSLRALRPLRVISRNPGMKLVVNALFRAIPAIVNVLFVVVLFFLIFGIVGVAYFKGAFNHCAGHVYDSLSEAQYALIRAPVPFGEVNATLAAAWGPSSGYQGATSEAVCGWLGASWEPVLPQNFDNILSASGTLYEMTTREGWQTIMYAGVDSTGIGMQPQRDFGVAWVIFFIFFIVVGSFFTMNLFVGVVIDNFNRMKEEMGDNVLLTEAQREWVRMQEAMQHLRPARQAREPREGVRLWMFRLVRDESFEAFIMTCIMANTGTMALDHFGMSHEFGSFLEDVNLLFAAIFTLEAIAKLMALGQSYFSDNWNRFDFSIVLGTNAGLILLWANGTDVGSLATIIRTFRVGRVIRLINSAKSLRVLFNTLIVTIPSLVNIGGLLLLMFFIYAVMGVQLFAHVQFGEFIDNHANFRTFGTAMITLLRASTGESWNGLMYDFAARDDGCSSDPAWDDPEPRGCGTIGAYPYFFSFTLLIAFVLLNVFVAVVLEGFSDISQQEDAVMSKDNIEVFAQKWVLWDPDATMLMRYTVVGEFLESLPPPMGLPPDMPAAEKESVIAAFQLPAYENNKVHFVDVAKSCARRAFTLALQARGEALEDLPESHKVARRWDRLKRNAGVEVRTQYNVKHMYAARSLRSALTTQMFRRNLTARLGEGAIEDLLAFAEGSPTNDTHDQVTGKALNPAMAKLTTAAVLVVRAHKRSKLQSAQAVGSATPRAHRVTSVSSAGKRNSRSTLPPVRSQAKSRATGSPGSRPAARLSGSPAVSARSSGAQ